MIMKKTLFDQLLGLHNNHLEIVGNNYVQNRLYVFLYSDRIEIETVCLNEYGSVWANEDCSIIRWEDINPNRLYNQLKRIQLNENSSSLTLVVDEGDTVFNEPLPF